MMLAALVAWVPSMTRLLGGGVAAAAAGAALGLVDRPGQRKIHAAPMPTGGGLAIWLGIVVPLAVGQAGALVLGAAPSCPAARRRLGSLPRVRRPAPAGTVAAIGPALDAAGRRHGADRCWDWPTTAAALDWRLRPGGANARGRRDGRAAAGGMSLSCRPAAGRRQR